VTGPVRVLVVDDHDLVRGGLISILRSDSGISVVGEAGDGPAAVRAADRLAPDVVLMDVQMPGGDGLAATRVVLAARPSTRVLVLTTFDLDEYVFEALRAGAAGFLLKTTPPAELLAAVHACVDGRTLLAPSVTRRLVETFVRRPPRAAPGTRPPQLRHLTDRELEVMSAMARGLSNAEIGRELYLGEATVKTHVTRVLGKLGLRDRVQVVVTAYETGLVTPGDGG
jgi:DNA-binding NarL/FixJ family response regulator